MIRNSRVLYIKRDLENLPSNDRPVSQRDGVKKIYERRHGKYEGWSDFTVDNNGKLADTVEEAAKVLGYKWGCGVSEKYSLGRRPLFM